MAAGADQSQDQRSSFVDTDRHVGAVAVYRSSGPFTGRKAPSMVVHSPPLLRDLFIGSRFLFGN